MKNKKTFAEIISTIDEDQEVENFSEESDDEVEVVFLINLSFVHK